MIRILIIDDHPLFRRGVRFFLQSLPDIEIVGEAENGGQALAILEKGAEVDLALLDLQMPGMDGVEVTTEIKVRFPGVKVLVLTSFNSWERVKRALQVGAEGYALKDAPPEELHAAIRAVSAGGSYFGAEVARKLIDSINGGEEELLAQLTARETEVLKLLALGLGNREIAEELIISEKTAKTHVANILQKLQVKSRTQAALYATQKGLV